MSAVPTDSPPSIPDDQDSGTVVQDGVPNLPPAPAGTDTRVLYFLQKVPIPSYLIALAVGELESRDLSDRYTQLSSEQLSCCYLVIQPWQR